ncbi:DEAD-box type RNA helicase, partial [Physocladia obscura]
MLSQKDTETTSSQRNNNGSDTITTKTRYVNIANTTDTNTPTAENAVATGTITTQHLKLSRGLMSTSINGGSNSYSNGNGTIEIGTGNSGGTASMINEWHPFHGPDSETAEAKAAVRVQLGGDDSGDDSSLNESSRGLVAAEGKLFTAMMACSNCAALYHDAKVRLTDAEVWRRVHERDCRLLCVALDDLAPLEKDRPAFRRAFNPIAEIVFRFPSYLESRDVDARFVHGLVLSQKDKVLKLRRGTSLVPGTLLLAAHAHSGARSWALAALLRTDAAHFADDNHVRNVLAPVLKAIVTRLVSLSSSSSTTSITQFNLASDPQNLWPCIAGVLACCSADGIAAILDLLPFFDDFVCDTLLSFAPENDLLSPFQYILLCFSRIRESCSFASPRATASTDNIAAATTSFDKASKLWFAIFASPWFQMIVKTSLWLNESHTLNLSDSWNACFAWIPSLFTSIFEAKQITEQAETMSQRDSQSDSKVAVVSNITENLLMGLVNDHYSWTDHAKQEFSQTALLPILEKRDAFFFSKETIDKICASCLAAAGGLAPADSSNNMYVLQHVVMQALTSDIDSLEQSFQDIYRDCAGYDETNASSTLLHTEIWRSLALFHHSQHHDNNSSNNQLRHRQSTLSLSSVLFNHVFKLFGRIYLLDHIKLPASLEEALTDDQRGYVQSYGTGLSLIWFVVQHGLSLAISNSSTAVDAGGLGRTANSNFSVADMLYCLVCRSDDISSLASQILLNMANTSKYTEMIDWVLKDNEQEKIETIINILNMFRDLCSMGQGPPLLGCAERIQILMKHVNHLVFISDESYRFNNQKPDLWIKSWPFVSSILSSSVKWAKEDLSIKRDIKVIIVQTLEIIKQLLANSNVLTSDELCASARAPFMNVIWSIFQWYRVLDDKIREEAVDVSVMYLRVADSLKYVLDEALVESVMHYTDGSLKSRLSESQKKTLEMWVMKMFEKQDAKRAKAKVAIDAVALESATVMKEFKVDTRETAVGQRRKIVDNDVESSKPAKFLKTDPAKVSNEPAKKATIPLAQAPKVAFKKLQPAQGFLSKLQMLRQEHFNQQRRLELNRERVRTTATILSRADSSDSETEISRKPIATSIKMLDDGMVIELDAHKKLLAQNKKPLAPMPKKKVQTRLRNLNELMKIFLKWRIEDTGEKPADFPFDLYRIPDRFESNDDYANVFEPLLILECWE